MGRLTRVTRGAGSGKRRIRRFDPVRRRQTAAAPLFPQARRGKGDEAQRERFITVAERGGAATVPRGKHSVPGRSRVHLRARSGADPA